MTEATLLAGTLGCDYSEYRPGGAEVKARGYHFVVRYLSGGTPKDITAPELADLHAQGLAVGFVWETDGLSPLYGAGFGTPDGLRAGKQLAELGVPADVPVFVALDTDDRGRPGWQEQMHAYLDAFATASGHDALPYGSNRVCDYFQSGWQAGAWDDLDADGNAVISEHAALLQRDRPTIPNPFPVDQVDEDLVLHSGQVMFYLPAVAPAPTPGGDVVFPGTVNTHVGLDFQSHAVRVLQGLLQANGMLITQANANHLVLAEAINRVHQLNGTPETGIADEQVFAWLLRKA